MKLDITARHFALTPAIESFVSKKVGGMELFVTGELKVHAILSVDKYLHAAELVVHADHRVCRAQAVSKDMLDAINKAVKKLERELSTHHKKEREKEIRKLRNQRKRGVRP